jgi:uncharacterized protein
VKVCEAGRHEALLKRGGLTMMRNREDVLKLIEQNQAALRKLGVCRLGLFGSCARGEATAESDLDFVVEFSHKSFDAYMDLKSFLEDLFRSRVDLVTVSSIKPRLLPIIQRETVYASGF